MKLAQEILENIRNNDVEKFIDNLIVLEIADIGMDVNFRPNSNALTFLHEAVASGSIEIIKRLFLEIPQLEFNLTANYKGYPKITPFHLAAIKGNEEIFNLLMLNDNVEISAVSEKGRTALHYLAIKGHKKLLKSFLSQMFLKIKVTLKDKDDKTALEYLQNDDDEDKELISLLKRAEESAGDIKKFVNDAKHLETLGKRRLVAGNYSAAIEKFNRAIELYRKAREPLPEFTQPIYARRLNVYFLRGKANFYSGELDNAIIDYLEVVLHRRKYSDSSDIFSVRKFIYFYLWEVYTKLQDENSANEHYEKAISQIGEKKLASIKKKYKTKVEAHCEELISDDSKDSSYYTQGVNTALLWHFAQQDEEPYFEMVKLFLRMGIMPNEIIFNDACEEVKALFNYRPSKHDTSVFTIYEFCRPDACADIESLNARFVDYENTSDEDSSDSEEDTFQVVNQELVEKNYLYQVARGVHYSSHYYNAKQRNDFKESDSHSKIVYSRAISELATKLEKKSDGTLDFEHADELVKSYFEMLKITPDKTEYDKNHNPKVRKIQGASAEFESLYHHFIHVYVNKYGYDALFNKGGMTRNFNFYSNDNPTLSVTPNVEVAFRYGSGERINHTSRFFGKLRISTGAFKHWRLGYVQVYLLSPKYYKKYTADVDKLRQENKIAISHNFGFNQEILCESSIPAEYVLGYQIFSLPSFRSDWSEATQKKYGLTESRYQEYQKRLLNAAQAFKTDETKEIIKELIIKITKHQATKLINSVKQLKNVSLENEYDFGSSNDRFEISEEMSKLAIKDSKEEISDSESEESVSEDLEESENSKSQSKKS